MSEPVFGLPSYDYLLPEDPIESLAETTAWAEFEHWMDEQLDQLVARWKPLAAPRADRISRRSQFGR